MWTNPLFPASLVTFTEEIFNENLHNLYSESDIRFLQPGIEMMIDISTSNTRMPADTGLRSRIDLETRPRPFKIT